MIRFRGCHWGLQLLSALFTSAVLVLVVLRSCVRYEVHRATSLLADASQIRVGDAEASVLPLVKRYDGFKWGKKEPLGAKEDYIDKDEYDYELVHEKELASDYKYSLPVSPFSLMPHPLQEPGRLKKALRNAMVKSPVPLRSWLGARDWGIDVEIAIRDGRVQSVVGLVLAEGHTQWLGQEWRFVSAMPRVEMQRKTFNIDASYLEMPTGGGELNECTFTPKASSEQVRVSRQFNIACLTSVRGCDGFCDFDPDTIAYLKEHPEAAGNIIPPKCK
jgi:hypothetical protein